MVLVSTDDDCLPISLTESTIWGEYRVHIHQKGQSGHNPVKTIGADACQPHGGCDSRSSSVLISVSSSVHVTARRGGCPPAIKLPFHLSGVTDNPCICFIIPVKSAL
ncbi:hypothetical protein BV22DRAFT_1038746, partial [Leucogyrophana mollusca]